MCLPYRCFMNFCDIDDICAKAACHVSTCMRLTNISDFHRQYITISFLPIQITVPQFLFTTRASIKNVDHIWPSMALPPDICQPCLECFKILPMCVTKQTCSAKMGSVTYGLKSFNQYESHIWNLLPMNIKSTLYLSEFKKLLIIWSMPACKCYTPYCSELMFSMSEFSRRPSAGVSHIVFWWVREVILRIFIFIISILYMDVCIKCLYLYICYF